MEVIISGIIKGNKNHVQKELSKLKGFNIEDFHYTTKVEMKPNLLPYVEEIIKKIFEIEDTIFTSSKTLIYTQSRMIYAHYAKKAGLNNTEIGN